MRRNNPPPAVVLFGVVIVYLLYLWMYDRAKIFQWLEIIIFLIAGGIVIWLLFLRDGGGYSGDE